VQSLHARGRTHVHTYTRRRDHFRLFLSSPHRRIRAGRSRGVLKFSRSPRRFLPAVAFPGGWGDENRAGARRRGRTKRENCMKNRLSLLAVRGRGFRRSCSRAALPLSLSLSLSLSAKNTRMADMEERKEKGGKKGGRAPQQMRHRVRRERARLSRPFSSSSSSVVPLFPLIIHTRPTNAIVALRSGYGR